MFLEILQNSQEIIFFIKKDTLAQVFSGEFCKISKNTFFTEHLCEHASVLSLSFHEIDKNLLREVLTINATFKFSKVSFMAVSRATYCKILAFNQIELLELFKFPKGSGT